MRHRHQEQKPINKFCKRPHSFSTIMFDWKIFLLIKESITITTSNCANISTARESERKYSNNINTVLVQLHIPVDDWGWKNQRNNNIPTVLVPKNENPATDQKKLKGK